ncbi:MAG: PqqD family protein [Gammaproteobacteria bacterium]|nr:PqqD family protein [Gammaproteobacteria bacterium]
MNLKQSVSLSPDALFQEVSGETVILDMASETYFGLDAVGTRVWQLMQEKRQLQPVFDALLQEYEVESETLEQDLASLLTSLEEAGLISLATVHPDSTS